MRTVQRRGVILHDLRVAIAVFDDIAGRRRAEEALQRIAFEDPLTKLPNRRALQQRWQVMIAEASHSGSSTALLMLDLDGFKAINDNFGHDIGDEALIEVARRLQASTSSTDMVCGLGGDEFAVLLPNLRASTYVEQVCWRIHSTLKLPWSSHGHPIELRGTIGVSLHPQDASDLPAMLKRADEALYQCKLSQRGSWRWFAVPDAA